MLKAALTALITATVTPVFSQSADHKIQKMYKTAPCKNVVSILDADPDISKLGLEATIRILSNQAMTWGFLLGVETLHPKIKGKEKTILTRLRKSCAQEIDTPALQILKDYIDEIE